MWLPKFNWSSVVWKFPADSYHLGLVIALESGRRHHVEEAIGAVAVFTGVAAALDLQLFHVLGIDQRAPRWRRCWY